MQVVKCILSLHWSTMLLLQRKSLIFQILLACIQGNKARYFLSWGKRTRILNRVQYCLQIRSQAVRMNDECYFTSYLPLLCAVPLSFALVLKSYSPFSSRHACYFFLSVWYSLSAMSMYFRLFFFFLICIFACQSCGSSYHQLFLNQIV